MISNIIEMLGPGFDNLVVVIQKILLEGEYFTATGRLAVDTTTAHVVALFFGVVIGLIACLCKMSKHIIPKAIATVYIEIIRGTRRWSRRCSSISASTAFW